MPKDKVEAAIKRAAGKDAANYEEVLYEGYAPHGVAVLVETATDNPTRTVANVRNVFNKNGGNLGTTRQRRASSSSAWACSGSNPEGIDQDDLELDLIDHGLEEMGESTGEKGEPQLVVRCAFADFGRAAEGARGPGHHADLRRVGVHLPTPDGTAGRPGQARCWSSSTSSSRTRTCRRCTTPSRDQLIRPLLVRRDRVNCCWTCAREMSTMRATRAFTRARSLRRVVPILLPRLVQRRRGGARLCSRARG